LKEGAAIAEGEEEVQALFGSGSRQVKVQLRRLMRADVVVVDAIECLDRIG
jgi:hypothetical protein